MKALVTGANGFTCSHLTRRVLAKGCAVRSLVCPRANPAALIGLPVELAHANLAGPTPRDDALQGIDLGFHVTANDRTRGSPQAVPAALASARLSVTAAIGK